MKRGLAAIALFCALLALPPAFSQDVRNTYIGVAAQIADGIITNAKLQNSTISIAGQSVALGGAARSQWYVLASSNVEGTVHTGDTNPATLATIALPANTIGANGRVQLRLVLRFTGTAGTKTVSATFGGQTFYSFAVGATGLSHAMDIGFTNRNSTASQIATDISTAAAVGFSTADIITMSVDSTSAQNILITGQLANAGDSIAVESYLVQVLP